MNTDTIKAEIARLAPTQRRAVRRYVAAVRPGDTVRVTRKRVSQADIPAHWKGWITEVYLIASGQRTILWLGPKGRVFRSA